MSVLADVDEYGFNVHIQSKAKRYLRDKILLSLVELIFFVTMAFIAVYFGFSQALRDLARGYMANPWGYIAIYFVIGYTVFWIFHIIFKFLDSYLIEHKYGVSVQTFTSWLKDQAKTYLGLLAFLLAVVELTYYSMREFPTMWWVITWLFASIGTIFAVYIFPVIIMPLFYRFEPLKDEELTKRLVKLAEKAGITVVGVYKMGAAAKTRKAIGALTGIGNTRRILLSDTLLNNYTMDEIEGVIGHELGHHVHKHIGKGVAVQLIFMLILFYLIDVVLRNSPNFFSFEGISDIANLPLFAVTVYVASWIFMPIFNTFSRKLEVEADTYELELVSKPESFITSMRKLCDQNLRYVNPHPLIEIFFYDHPSGRKRIELAQKYLKSKS